MALQISEPGSNVPVQEQQKTVGSIDFGTQNSLIAYWDAQRQQANIIEIDGATSIKSVVKVEFSPDGKQNLVAVPHGISPDQGSQNSRAVDTIQSVKRLLGRSKIELEQHSSYGVGNIVQDSNDKLKWHVGSQYYSAEQLAAVVIKALVKASCDQGMNIAKFVITVPAYFDEEQRQAVQNAARFCGIEVLKLISEPTAAALHLIGNNQSGMYAVYDFGGGTFDFTVLLAEDGVYQVLTTQGDSWLGGDDMDAAITNEFRRQITQVHGKDFQYTVHESQLLAVACSMREALSETGAEQNQELFILHPNKPDISDSVQVSLNLHTLNQLMQPIIVKSLAIANQSLAEAGIKREELTSVLAVGGVTRTPLMREMLQQEFTQVVFSHNPDNAVVLGGASHAAAISNQKNDHQILMDVLPISIGIETAHGIIEKIINRNTPIPITKHAEFTNWKVGQTGMVLHLLQGERPQVEHCISLASMTLSGLESKVIGDERVKVSVTVDEDGLMHLAAENLRNSETLKIVVQNKKALDEEEIIRIINDANSNKQKDVDAHKFAQIKAEASMLLTEIESRELLTLIDEKQPTRSKELEQLLNTLKGSIENAHELVEEQYAQLRQFFFLHNDEPQVKNVLEQSLRGKSIEELE